MGVTCGADRHRLIERFHHMIKFRNEDGLTLIELLVVIALVGIVAAISLPILLNTVQTSQTKADAASATDVTNFKHDELTAGYLLLQGGSAAAVAIDPTATDAASIYAFDNDGHGVAKGAAVAQIKGSL